VLHEGSAVLAFVLCIGATLEPVRAITQRPSVVLADPLCDPPCWNGITPGATSADEVYSILARTEGVDFGTLFERIRGDQTLQFSWFFSAPIPDSTGRIYFIGGEVAAITIGTYGSADVEEILGMLGPPAA